LKWLEESCKRNGTTLIVLGMGTEWKGYITKYILINKFLENLHDDDVVCFVDAYDVLMIQHIDKLKEKFLDITNNTDYKMICALDCYCPPILKGIHSNTFGVGENSLSICSGTYISYVKFLKESYKWMIEYSKKHNEIDDQYILNRYYDTNKDYIYIDKSIKIFKTDYEFIWSKTDKDDYVFLHRVTNSEMITPLIYYEYNISLDEYSQIINNTLNDLQKKIPYFVNTIFKRIICNDNKF
jgi:hypothetical protein